VNRPIGIIGCGNMGSALVRGMIDSHFRPASDLIIWDIDQEKRKQLVKSGVCEAESSQDLVSRTTTVLLAVKPQQMNDVLSDIRPHLKEQSLIISIAAGIQIGWIKKRLNETVKVIRAMPNTPAVLCKGISAIAGDSSVGDIEFNHAELLFRSVGGVVRVPEEWMDAVTAISGSGPAYFFYLMQRMIEVGVELGLSDEVARKLVLSTAIGAGAMIGQAGDPGNLRKQVTSKGGTTEAAFQVFEKEGLDEILAKGIRAAARRAKEMSA